MRKLSLIALAVLTVAPACRDSSGDDAVTPDSNGTVNPDDVTIQQIQDMAMPNGTAVKLRGVVVTAIDKYGMKQGDFWVEEPGGGAFSGIHVFGAPLDQVTALAIGDVVDIDGAQKDDFHYEGNMGSGGFAEGYAITELKPVTNGMMTVTKAGSTMTITPDVVDALAIGQMTDFMARDAEWEKWEGVLIKLTNVQAFSSDACVGSACSDPMLHKFDVTGDIVVESALAAMPMPNVASGDCLSSVTGVVDYFFDYQLLPRTTDEIGVGGTACPTENSANACGDNIDNDGNGFKDCNDNGCIVGSATCRNDNATIPGIQAGTDTGAVRVANAIVTAVSFNKKEVWIAAAGAGATNAGIQVHFNDPVANTITVGKTVDVIGKVTEFNDSAMMGTQTLTEINGYQITVIGSTTTATTGLAATAATMNNDTTGEPYESVLVMLTNVKLKTVADATNHIGTMNQGGTGGTDFKFDDTIFRIGEAGCTMNCAPVRAANTCWSSITGIWSYNVFDNNWVFLPRKDATMNVEDGTLAGNQNACP